VSAVAPDPVGACGVERHDDEIQARGVHTARKRAESRSWPAAGVKQKCEYGDSKVDPMAVHRDIVRVVAELPVVRAIPTVLRSGRRGEATRRCV
jgi:hypothetical protein